MLSAPWLQSEVEIDNRLTSWFEFTFIRQVQNTATHSVCRFRNVTVKMYG
jgi:hypothetical protein